MKIVAGVGELDDICGNTAIRAYAAAVLRRNPTVEFLIRGDKEVAYEAVVNAMVLLQQGGVPSVGLITDPGEGG